MAGKSKATTTNTKTPRKAVKLTVKLDIIQRYENGESIPDIAKCYGLKQATIGIIIKFKDKIGDKAVYDSSLGKSSTTKTGLDSGENHVIAKVEKLLALWMTKEGLWKVPMDKYSIRQKAMEIYTTLKDSHRGKKLPKFKANSKWFGHFRRRHGNLMFNEPKAEKGRAKDVLNLLNTIIEKNDYSARQVFYLDEIVIPWKSIPIQYTSLPFVNKIQNLNETVTVLLTTNAEADSNITPLFVHHAETPPELRDITKSSLPLIWASSPNGNMTVENFKEWYFKNFIPETKLYCEVNRIPFKILLLLRSSRTHPLDLDDFHPDIKVVVIPANVASIVLPMRVTYAQMFLNIYVRRLLSNMLESQEREHSIQLEEFWRDYNIYSCIKNVKYCWDELTSTYKNVLNAAWEKTYASFVNNIIDSQAVADEIVQDIINLHKYIVHKYIEPESNCHDEPSNEDETRMETEELKVEPKEEINETQIIKEEQTINEEENSQPDQRTNLGDSKTTISNTDVQLYMASILRKFDKTRLAEAFQKIDDALIILESMDTDCSRFANVSNTITNAISPYKRIYHDKKH